MSKVWVIGVKCMIRSTLTVAPSCCRCALTTLTQTPGKLPTRTGLNQNTHHQPRSFSSRQSRLWSDEQDVDWGDSPGTALWNPGLAFKPPIKARGRFACDSAGAASTVQGQSAASAPSTASELSVWHGVRPTTNGDLPCHIPLAQWLWSQHVMQNRFKEEKHCLHLQHAFSEAALKTYQLATFYYLQYCEENSREAYPCTATNLEQQEATLPWDAMSFPIW